jgi:hypothetical protein
MEHHGDDSEALDLMKKMFAERFSQAQGLQQDISRFGLGPTGAFPEGELNDDDEGEIRIAIGMQGDKVVIDFGKPTAWIGFTKEQAKQIAEMLLKHAGY